MEKMNIKEIKEIGKCNSCFHITNEFFVCSVCNEIICYYCFNEVICYYCKKLMYENCFEKCEICFNYICSECSEICAKCKKKNMLL